MDKQTMLRQVRESREALEAMLAAFDDAQLTAAHPPDGWSGKDVMVHITFWEQFVLDRYLEAGRGGPIHHLGKTSSDADINRVNQETLDAGRARSLATVKAGFAEVHRALWAALETMPEDPADGWWTLWPEPDRPWKIVQYNTWDHYAEHMTQMQTWGEA